MSRNPAFRMSPYEPCNFYAPFGDRAHAVPEYYMDVRPGGVSSGECSKFYQRDTPSKIVGDALMHCLHRLTKFSRSCECVHSRRGYW